VRVLFMGRLWVVYSTEETMEANRRGVLGYERSEGEREAIGRNVLVLFLAGRERLARAMEGGKL
jgi:hypothetical protein